MLSFINLPARIIGLLESNVSSREIAAGVCLGMFLGFTPLNGPMAILLMIFFFLFKVNRVSTLLTMPLFKAAYLLGVSGLLEKLGGLILIDAKVISNILGLIASLPVVAYLDLNNTLVAGGLAGSAGLSIPLYFISKQLATALKGAYAAKIKNSRIAKAISGMKVVSNINTAVNTDSGLGLSVKGIKQLFFTSIKARMAKGKAPVTGWRKRVNIAGFGILILALVVVQFGVGMIISPFAGSFIIDTMNRSAGTKIAADRVNIWPLTLSFSIKGLKVFDPKETDKRIVKADDASFRISPLALLSKRIVFSSIHLNGAEIDVEGRPDGSFNVQALGQPAEPKGTGIASLWKSVTGKKSSASGKLMDFIKKKFSKSGQEERKLKRASEKGQKTVTELPKGRRVQLKTGRGSYLFEIKKLSLDNGSIKIKSASGDAIEIDKAHIGLKSLRVDPEDGAAIGEFSIKGNCVKDGNAAGSLDIAFAQSETGARLDLHLKDIDLNAVRFVYQDSLPVNIVKGTVTLSSKTSIRGDAIDSRTSLSLTGHELQAKDGSKIALGVIPMAMIVEALNSIDPVKLKFSIGGTVEKPELGNFQESLMSLVGPSISNLKEKVVKEGANALGKLLTGSSGAAAGQEAAQEGGKTDTVQNALNAFKSILGDKKE